MKQIPSLEANRFSATHEIPRVLRNPKFHYRIHNSPPPVPTLTPINPVHASSPYSLKFNLILSFLLRLGLPSGIFHHISPPNPCMHLCCPPNAPRGTHFINLGTSCWSHFSV